MTPFQAHVQKWKSCSLCDLSKTRTNVVIARGTIPADVLFVGEAPGRSEDTLSQPFVGPAGAIMDRIITRTLGRYPRLTYCLTNLVACLPLGDDNEKLAQPPPKCIKACGPRLEEIFDIVSPRLVVAVGTLAEKWLPEVLPQAYDGPVVAITHPGAMLPGRVTTAQSSIMRRRAEVTLLKALNQL